jgi:hypothetical protein
MCVTSVTLRAGSRAKASERWHLQQLLQPSSLIACLHKLFVPQLVKGRV